MDNKSKRMPTVILNTNCNIEDDKEKVEEGHENFQT